MGELAPFLPNHQRQPPPVGSSGGLTGGAAWSPTSSSGPAPLQGTEWGSTERVASSSGFAPACGTYSPAFLHLLKGAPHGASFQVLVSGEGPVESLVLVALDKC